MKKTVLFTIGLLCNLPLIAQVTDLHENFDVACSAATFPYSDYWQYYNPVSGTSTNGAWECTATNGRWSSPGMQVTGVYGSAYHLDTSYLITPLMNITLDPDSVYLDFDTRADSIVLGGRLSVIAITDTPYSDTIDLTTGLVPSLGVADSTGWVTHQANITFLKDSNFYITFRYTSTAATGSIWYLDNVNTSSISYTLKSSELNHRVLPVTVTGQSTTDRIALTYSTPTAGNCNIMIYDILGQLVYKNVVEAPGGKSNEEINGLQLHPGMYFIKIENGLSYGIAKTIVQ